MQPSLAHGQRDGAQRPGSAAGAGPPPSQGSKAGAEQTPGLSRAGRGVGPHCPQPCRAPSQPPDPTAPRGAPGRCPLLTLAVSFLCKQLNKLFGDRQARVWVQWRRGQRRGAGLLLALSPCRHLPPRLAQSSKRPGGKGLKGAERFLLYSRIFYIPYTYMPIHTHIHLCSRPVPPGP